MQLFTQSGTTKDKTHPLRPFFDITYLLYKNHVQGAIKLSKHVLRCSFVSGFDSHAGCLFDSCNDVPSLDYDNNVRNLQWSFFCALVSADDLWSNALVTQHGTHHYNESLHPKSATKPNAVQ